MKTTKSKKIIHSPITYKIFIDVLLVLLIVSIGFLTIETILPGIASTLISPFIIFAFLFFCVVLITLLAHTQNITVPYAQKKYTLFILGLLFFVVLSGIASYRYGLFFAIIIVLFSVATYTFFYLILHDILQKN